MDSHKICSLSLLESLHEKLDAANVEAKNMQNKLREAEAAQHKDTPYAIADANLAAAYAEGIRAAYAETRIWIEVDLVKQHDEECRAAAAVDAILRRAGATR